MGRKTLTLITSILVIFGLLAVAAPAFAKSDGGKVSGTISAVDTTAQTLTIAPKKGGVSVTLTVDAGTSIKRLGKPATLADLLVGDKVEAKYNPQSMLASKIYAKLNLVELKGIVKSVDTGAGTLIVTNRKTSMDVTLKVDAATTIKRLGKPVTLADLMAGDRVEAKYNPLTMLAAKIYAWQNQVEMKGTIKSVDAAAGTLIVTDYKTNIDVPLKVDAKTNIKRLGKSATLADLMVGDKVEVKYDLVSMLASKIEAKLNQNEVEGIIKSVDAAGNSLVITDYKTSMDVTLKVDASTFIKRMGMPAILADLLVGDKVEAKYDPISLLASKIEAK